MPISFAVVENGALRAAQGVDAPVPWWSFTKTVIAAAALALVRDARLQLDRPLPNRPFTLRQLLGHRAGATNYGGLAAYGEAVERGDEPWPVPMLLERTHAERLRYPPGQGWAYSNIGYLFVRELIEETCRENSRRGTRTAGAASTRHSPSAAGADPRPSRNVAMGDACVYHPGWVYHGLLVGRLPDAALLLDRLMTARCCRRTCSTRCAIGTGLEAA